MRVLINALQAGNRSGTGRYVEELIRWLPGLVSDVEVRVLWPGHVPAPPAVPAEALMPVQVQTPWQRLYCDQFGMRRIRREVQADLVHYPANIGALAPVVPFVLTVHDLSFYRKATWYRTSRAVYYWVAARRSILAARRIVADSKTTADDLMNMLHVPARKIDVIPLGVGEEFKPAPPERQAAVRAKYHLPANFFLYVGTLEPRKNLPRVIEAWDQIAAGIPHDLVIAGREGWKTAPIHAAVKRARFASRIHFPGFIEQADLPALLSAAAVFVWPSLCEGFGLPPLESMACGTPVLSSDLSCMPETLADAALLVDPYTTEDIAAGMKALATDNALYERLRQKGFARAQRFTWKHTAELTISSYRNAIKA